MKNNTTLINKLAKQAQQDGDIEELLYELTPHINLAIQFFINKNNNISLDSYSLISVASYESLNSSLNGWDSELCDFLPRFKKYMFCRFGDILRAELRGKRIAISRTIPLDTPIDSTTTVEESLIYQEQQQPITDEINEALYAFGVAKGCIKMEIARALIEYSHEASGRVRAICEIYGVTEYNGTIRVRVDAVKKSFAKFLIKNNYIKR
jgi:hypothetical protein